MLYYTILFLHSLSAAGRTARGTRGRSCRSRWPRSLQVSLHGHLTINKFTIISELYSKNIEITVQWLISFQNYEIIAKWKYSKMAIWSLLTPHISIASAVFLNYFLCMYCFRLWSVNIIACSHYMFLVLLSLFNDSGADGLDRFIRRLWFVLLSLFIISLFVMLFD